ncbi:MAG: hypothetical protein LBC74_07150 [Planctomycetaceae bacterium]|jgi:hypothetical protein|nr:hypothetical protein [Planctomycetaceae bacterium]
MRLFFSLVFNLFLFSVTAAVFSDEDGFAYLIPNESVSWTENGKLIRGWVARNVKLVKEKFLSLKIGMSLGR